jgi:hypothetical protein
VINTADNRLDVVTALGGPVVSIQTDKMGIGTTTPEAKLVVHEPAEAAELRVDGLNGTVGLTLGADATQPWVGTRTNHDLRLLTNNTEKMRVQADGHVGIGNATPDHVLVVGPPSGGRHLVVNDIPTARWGFATGEYNLAIQNDGSGTWETRLLITKNGYVGIGTAQAHRSLTIEARDATISLQDLNITSGRWEIQASAFQPDTFGIVRYDANQPAQGSKSLVITNSGNVGIGTTTPGTKLHIAGPAPADANSAQVAITAPNNKWLLLGRADSYGFVQSHQNESLALNPLGNNVGIGTTQASQRLTLGSGNILLPPADDGIHGNLYFGGITDAGQTGLRLFGASSIDPSGFIDVRTTTLNHGLVIRVDTTDGSKERMRVTAGGSVGIGTPAPRFGRLMIEDMAVPLSLRETDVTVDQGGLWRIPLEGGVLRFDVNTGAPGSEFGTNYRTPLAMTKDGNVGIGTTTPRRKLHIVGPAPADANEAQVEIADPNGNLMLLGRAASYGFVQSHQNEPLALNPLGNNVGIGTSAPAYALDVVGRILLRQGTSGSADLWLFQTTANAERAFIGMMDDHTVGFWGNTGIGWGLKMDTTSGDITLEGDLSIRKTGDGYARFTHATYSNENQFSANNLKLSMASTGATFPPPPYEFAIGHTFRSPIITNGGTSFVKRFSVNHAGDVTIAGALNKLDIADNYTAIVRCADFLIGHSNRRRTPGRALVDATTVLGLNWENDWPQGVRYYGQLSQVSARALKENITDVSVVEALEALAGLQPVTFNFKADEHKTLQLGFIAEDVPRAIATPDRQGVVTSHIVAILTKVVQEQQTLITQLTNKVRQLEAVITPRAV